MAVLNDARQKIVEIKFPVKQRVMGNLKVFDS